MFTANYGLVLIITSETELEIPGACCAKVLTKKRFEKGHEMDSGCLESRTGLEIKGHCLSTSLRLQAKAIES